MNYLSIIKISIVTFPFIAFLITLPYILREYHKYGSVYWYRAIIIYSFILYLLTAYFLVILPLPNKEEVMALTTPTTQLIPFNFISDFISKSGFVISDFSTYFKSLTSSYVFVPLFNIILTIPFGAYLHYYFKFSFKKTCLFTFLLSLFFELTQLSGLYFIYPRGYRLFDVDDLILNTLGGIIGYFVGTLLLKFLPNREEIDDTALELGTKVSIIRRTLAYGIDLFIFLVFYMIIRFTFNITFAYNFYVLAFIYFIIIPWFFKGQTLAYKFLKIKIISTKYEKVTLIELVLRNLLFYAFYVILPILIIILCGSIVNYFNNSIYIYTILLLILFIFLYYVISFFTLAIKKTCIYERWSKTKIISTIKKNQNEEMDIE